MITVSECATFAGLASNELVLGAIPSSRHHSLLSSYLLTLGRGPQAVRDMIIADMRRFLDLGVTTRAADLLIVLRMFLSDFPEARGSGAEPTSAAAARSESARPAEFYAPHFAAQDKEGVVVALPRHRRSNRAERLRVPRDRDDAAIARLGSRLFYLRGDR